MSNVRQNIILVSCWTCHGVGRLNRKTKTHNFLIPPSSLFNLPTQPEHQGYIAIVQPPRFAIIPPDLSHLVTPDAYHAASEAEEAEKEGVVLEVGDKEPRVSSSS